MDYQRMIERVMELDFVSDKETADSAIKSVLGHLASRMKEQQAEQFSSDLPDPLTLQKLRGHQTYVMSISLTQFVEDLRRQFGIDTDQAQTLIRTVLNVAKADVPDDHLGIWEDGLPAEWAAMVRNA